MMKKMLASMLIFTLIPVAAFVWILVFQMIKGEPMNLQAFFTQSESAAAPPIEAPVDEGEEKEVINEEFSTSVNEPAYEDGANEPVEEGALKGTITWQYNDFVGTKGDVGADVILISKEIDQAQYEGIDFSLLTHGIVKGEVPGIHITEADGYGHYEMNNIPAGSYVLLVVSSKTNRDVSAPLSQYTITQLQALFGQINTEDPGMLDLKKHIVEEIQIQGNQTTNFSHDFGYTFI